MNHFSESDLHRWRESGADGDRERIVGHLAECSDCSSRYASAIREAPLQAEPAADAQEFIAAGRRIGPRRRWIPLAMAAAAVLILAIGIPLFIRERTREVAHDLQFRGGGIELLAPQGTLDHNDVDCQWVSGIIAVRYRIQIGNEKGVVFSRDTEATRTHVTLAPGAYWWTVTALDGRGKPVASSQRAAFTIRSR